MQTYFFLMAEAQQARPWESVFEESDCVQSALALEVEAAASFGAVRVLPWLVAASTIRVSVFETLL